MAPSTKGAPIVASAPIVVHSAHLAALEAAGVQVTERVPHRLPDNPHNARYLATKRDRAGHLLP